MDTVPDSGVDTFPNAISLQTNTRALFCQIIHSVIGIGLAFIFLRTR